MNIQFVVTDPDYINNPSETSAIVGLVTRKDDLPDYSVFPVYFEKTDKGFSLTTRQTTNETLIERTSYSPEVTEARITDLLSMTLWKEVAAIRPAGEVAFIKTRFPETPEGETSYLIVGLIKGNYEYLKELSGKLFSANADSAKTFGVWDCYEAVDTGIRAKQKPEHQLGVSILGSHIWGFGDKKYKASSLMNTAMHDDVMDDFKHMIEHGEGRNGEVHPNSRLFLKYIRGMDKAGAVDYGMWGEEQRDKEIEVIERKVSDKVFNQQNDSPSP